MKSKKIICIATALFLSFPNVEITVMAKHEHSYKVRYTTKATVSRDGIAKYTCKKCGHSKKVKYAKIGSVKLSNSSYTYNGKAKKPRVVVKTLKGSKISSKYYTVKYTTSSGKRVSSIKNVGTYFVKVTFKGKYSGTVKKTVKVEKARCSHEWDKLYKNVLVTPAWEEEIPVYEEQEVCICYGCGENISDILAEGGGEEHAYNHMINGEDSGWFGGMEYVQVGTKVVKYDAVYEKVQTGFQCKKCGMKEMF